MNKRNTEQIDKNQYKTSQIMVALLVAGFVGLFSETALNIALGDLSKIFSVNATTVQWLATGYFLTLGILVPVTGILMQKFTTRQMLITSISLLILGTVLAAAAPTFSILLAGRVIQAAGLAINLPLTQSVIFTIFPAQKRGSVMGIMGLVILGGPALGPTLAGLILDTLSWRWIFLLTLPFLLFSLIFGYIYMPNVNKVKNISIDMWSLVLSTIGFGGIVYGISIAGEVGWGSSIVIASIIIGILTLVLFGIRQNKMENPMLNLKVFSYPLFVLGIFMTFITFFNLLSILVVLPIYMRGALLIASFTTGLILLPGSLLNCMLAPKIGSLFDKYGPRVLITPGAILIVIAYLVYSHFSTNTSLWAIVLTHIVMMIGIGMVITSVQTNTLNSIPSKYYPDGIALAQTVQQVSGAIGIAVMISVLSAKQNAYLDMFGNDMPGAVVAGSTLAFKIGLILSVINVILSLFIKSSIKENVK